MRIRFACWIIEIGIKLLPNQYQSERFIRNCIKTGHIKVEKKL